MTRYLTDSWQTKSLVQLTRTLAIQQFWVLS